VTRETFVQTLAARVARVVVGELRERNGVVLRGDDERVVFDVVADELGALIATREETAKLVRQAWRSGLQK
jgi:hypothetical protein